MLEYGLTLRFKVTIDHKVDLGNWTKCEGLTVEWEVQEYREGGLNDYVHRLPGRRKFQNIKLTRPIDAGSREVAALDLQGGGSGGRPHRQIAHRGRRGQPGRGLGRLDIWPTRWTGPNMDVNGKDIAFETLELAHSGFTAV